MVSPSSEVKSHRKANIWELGIIESENLEPQSVSFIKTDCVLYWRFYCIAALHGGAHEFTLFFLTEGQDFDFISGPPVIIEAGGNSGCLQISIITDEVVEQEEEIRLAINTMTTDFDTSGSITETTVVILRDGGIFILVLNNNNLPPLPPVRLGEYDLEMW